MAKLTLWVLIFWLITGSAMAQTIRVQPEVINAEKGLPSNTVFEVIEGDEGLLWISTEQGVFIYDGYTIRPVNSFLQGAHLRDEPAVFFKEINGTLWIHQMGLLFCYQKQQKRFFHFTYPLKSGGFKNNFRLLSKNKDELILQHLFDSSLIFNTRSSKFYWIALNGNSINKTDKIQFPTIECKGYYFKVNAQNELLRVDSEGKQLKKLTHLQPSKDVIRGTKIISIKPNYLLVGTGVELLVVNTQTWQVQSIRNIAGNHLISNGKIMHLYKNRLGRLFIATNSSGILSIPFQLNQFFLFRSGNPQNNFIRSVFPDATTNKIYAGLYFNSVAVFNKNGLPDEATSKKWQNILQSRKVTVVNMVDKIGTNDWLLFSNGNRIFKLNDQKMSCDRIRIIPPLGTDSTTLASYNYSSFANIQKTENGEYIAVYLKHILHFKYDAGSLHVKKVLNTLNSYEGIFIDDNQHIFIGNNGYVESFYQNWKRLQRIQLPEQVQVKAITKDKNGLLWIGTRNGIFIYKQNILLQKITDQNGLLNDFIYALHADTSGYIWCSTNKGLASINSNNFSVTTFTKFDGLQDNEFNSGAMYVDSNGRVYFGGINGITSFHPKNIPLERTSEKVQVMEVKGNGTSFYNYLLNGNNQLVAEHFINNFVFYFSSFGLNPTADIYEYKINQDTTWTPIRSQNFFNIYLTGGKHAVSIRKLNQPATETIFTLQVRLPFFKQRWFLVFVSIVTIILIGLFIQRRQRALLKEKEQLLFRERALQVERERISKELHDNLGAHANIISYHTQQLKSFAPNDFEAAAANNTFGKIKSSADEILLSLRETVWALQQNKITSKEAWMRFQNFIFRVQDSFQHIHFIVADIDTMPEYEIEYQQAVHLIRILQEATSNAIKHANAQQIKFDIIIHTAGFTIVIEDNGVGFNELENKWQGNGLENMRSRAKSAGFSFKLISKPSKGTIVNIGYEST